VIVILLLTGVWAATLTVCALLTRWAAAMRRLGDRLAAGDDDVAELARHGIRQAEEDLKRAARDG